MKVGSLLIYQNRRLLSIYKKKWILLHENEKSFPIAASLLEDARQVNPFISDSN